MHSGTGRISKMSMTPMSLFESNESNGQISLKELFENVELDIDGIFSELSIERLIFAACRGGWPSSLRNMNREAQLLIAQDYVNIICSDDISRVDGTRRNPTIARLIMRSSQRSLKPQSDINGYNYLR